MPPGLRKSGIPELGADAGAGKDDGAPCPCYDGGERGDLGIGRHAETLAKLRLRAKSHAIIRAGWRNARTSELPMLS